MDASQHQRQLLSPSVANPPQSLAEMRQKKAAAAAKAPEAQKLTSYEICVQKYTKYMRMSSFDRC